MIAKKALEVLGTSRASLSRYVKQGLIRTDVMVNGHYDYNDSDVYEVYRSLQGIQKAKPAQIDNRIEEIENFIKEEKDKANKSLALIKENAINLSKKKGTFNLDEILDLRKLITNYGQHEANASALQESKNHVTKLKGGKNND